HDRDLQRSPIHVEVASAEKLETIAVIPDGWVDLRLAGVGRICLALELDRGTIEQKDWRRKVRGLVAYSQGPYQQAFQTNSLTIAVVVAPGRQAPKKRLQDLLVWTERELEAIGTRDQADL